MRDTKPLGVGLIGTGFMGKCHAVAWAGVAPVFGDVAMPRRVILADATPDLAAAGAAALDFAEATGDWRAVVAHPDVDVVSITAPNTFHAEMAIAALKAGKHIWCEKPMSGSLEEAERMAVAADAAGRAAVLGYNYIQNPVIRHIRRLLEAGTIGEVNQVRMEMDEDFMADPAAPFSWRSDEASGYGALDDFCVHLLSITRILFGGVARVFTDMGKPYAERPLAGGGTRPVRTYDQATVLARLDNGALASFAVSRAAWGRKGRLAIQIFGSAGSILFDQERMNEFRLYTADGAPETRGYRTILTAPHHPPYDRFVPAPGHGLGFNDLKVIECRELINVIDGAPAHAVTFADGIAIERAVHAMGAAFQTGAWQTVAGS